MYLLKRFEYLKKIKTKQTSSILQFRSEATETHLLVLFHVDALQLAESN